MQNTGMILSFKPFSYSYRNVYERNSKYFKLLQFKNILASIFWQLTSPFLYI